MKLELGLPNYATKSDLKEATNINASKFAKKVDLANLNWDVDKLDIDKLKTVSVDLSKPSDAVKNKVVKKNFYDKLADDIQNNDNIDFIKNAELKGAKVVVIEKKITTYDN